MKQTKEDILIEWSFKQPENALLFVNEKAITVWQALEAMKTYADQECAEKDREIERLRGENSALAGKETDGWISVDERLPEIGERVQMYFPLLSYDQIQAGYIHINEAGQTLCTRDNYLWADQFPTHWQPLPSPPKTGRE